MLFFLVLLMSCDLTGAKKASMSTEEKALIAEIEQKDEGSKELDSLLIKAISKDYLKAISVGFNKNPDLKWELLLKTTPKSFDIVFNHLSENLSEMTLDDSGTISTLIAGGRIDVLSKLIKAKKLKVDAGVKEFDKPIRSIFDVAFNSYTNFEIANMFVEEGFKLEDSDKKKYLDAISSMQKFNTLPKAEQQKWVDLINKAAKS